MSKEKLMTARELIKAQKYDEARTLLQNIDSPAASKWIKKLNELDPFYDIDSEQLLVPSTGGVSSTLQKAERQASKAPYLRVISLRRSDIKHTVRRAYTSLLHIMEQVSWTFLLSLAVITILGTVTLSLQLRLSRLSKDFGKLVTDVSVISQISSEHTTDLNSLDTDVTELVRVVNSHATDIDLLDSDISELVRVVNSHASDINSLDADIRAVAAVADNANFYAHSHPYSDISLKTNIAEIADPLEGILSLRGISFTWNSTAYPDLHLEEGREYGVLAQEVELVFPELVTTDPQTGLLQVDYMGLIPVLIEAIREQQSEIDALRAELEQSD